MATICSTLFICGMSSLVVHTHAETKSRTEIKKRTLVAPQSAGTLCAILGGNRKDDLKIWLQRFPVM